MKSPNFQNLESPSPKDALCQVDWNWQNGSGKRIVFNLGTVFSQSRHHLHLEKGVVLYLNKIEFFISEDALCRFGLKLSQWFLRENFVLNSSLHFRYFVIISPGKRVWSLIWTNLNSLHSSMLCAEVWLKVAQWILRIRYFKFRHSYFATS